MFPGSILATDPQSLVQAVLTNTACAQISEIQEEISRKKKIFFLRDIQEGSGVSWLQWSRRSWQGHRKDKDGVGSWGLEGRKDETSCYVPLCSHFIFATGRTMLCLVGVYMVFSVLALTFNQYWLILWRPEISDLWLALQK